MKQTILILTILTSLTLQGCGVHEPKPCEKAQIQIADMTDKQYQRCKGLPYEGKK